MRSLPSTPRPDVCSGRASRSPTTSSYAYLGRRQGAAGRHRRPRDHLRRSERETAQHAWPDSGKKSLQSYGRGLLAGDLIYWPTLSEIQVLDQQTGLRNEQPIRLRDTFHTTGGNLVAGDGYLIVAQADGMVVFCQNSRLIQRYGDEIVRAPNRASNYYRHARAAEATGREELALDSYRHAIEKAQPNESIDGIPLAGAARDKVFRLLMRLAGRSRHDGHWEEAIERLDRRPDMPHSDPERLESRLLLAEILLDASRPHDAVDALERILTDERLRGLPVAADGHRTIRADLMVTDRLGLIVRRHGRVAYDALDRQARELYQRGKTERDPHVLRSLPRVSRGPGRAGCPGGARYPL